MCLRHLWFARRGLASFRIGFKNSCAADAGRKPFESSEIRMNRIPFEELKMMLSGVLVRLGFAQERAERCAQLFAETTRDGVYTHGVARFPRFVAMIRNGSVDVHAEPVLKTRLGAVERWDGCRGPGNAEFCMERAIALGRVQGVGCVALGNTNHWMRGGTYGWQAAEARLIGMCWTNTMPNMPPWGGLDPVLGNNPLVIGVPRAKRPVVMDTAMSQFSYGALEGYRTRGEQLPVPGGFDGEGELTRDPAAIEKSQRVLPAGYWKGSGISIVLDMMGAMLGLGLATHQLGNDPLRETGISQVFLAVDPAAFGSADERERIADAIVSSVERCTPAEAGRRVRCPGERTLRAREENTRLGLPVDAELWKQILGM
jgi:3-dehydro-L-gulonate 2-dehydrogenase